LQRREFTRYWPVDFFRSRHTRNRKRCRWSFLVALSPDLNGPNIGVSSRMVRARLVRAVSNSHRVSLGQKGGQNGSPFSRANGCVHGPMYPARRHTRALAAKTSDDDCLVFSVLLAIPIGRGLSQLGAAGRQCLRGVNVTMI